MTIKKIYGIVRNMRKTKTLTTGFIVLGTTLLFIFASVELSLRIFYPQLTTSRVEKISPQIFEDSDYTPWRLKPNSSSRIISGIGNEFNIPVHINSYGLRDDEILKDEIETKEVIGVIGDSFTFGSGVSLENTYHQKLESMLNSESEDYRVINMGRADGSLTTDVQYLYLRENSLKFKPKIIILGYYVGNDITDLGKKTIWVSTDADGNPINITTTYTYIDEKNRYRRNYENRDATGIFNGFNKFMSHWSHTYMFLKRWYIGAVLVSPDQNHVSSYTDDYLKKFDTSKKLLLEINKILRLRGTEFVVMLIPSKVQVDDRIWGDYDLFYGENAYRFNPQEEIMQFCNEKNIKCLDLLPDFIGKPELYFKIDGHWNERGHELAAMKLREYLIKKELA